MSNPIGDRNLLFGILAMQKNIISRDVFLAAMNAWLQDKKKGLAQILREQQALSENHHAVLEELVDDHLARHGQDAQKSLGALSMANADRQDLQKLADADVQAGLACVPNTPPKPVKTVAPASKAQPPKLQPMADKAPAPKPTKKTSDAKPKAGGIPAWALIVGGAAVGVVVAVVATGAIIIAALMMVVPRPVADDKGAPIIEVMPNKDGGRPKDQDKPPVQVPEEIPPIKEPPGVVVNDFVPLFNGKDLTGWKTNPRMPGNWRVEEGVLVGSAAGKTFSRLYSERPLSRDFHVRIRARVAEKGAGRICFRCPDDSLLGYDALIQDVGDDQVRIGSLEKHVPGTGTELQRVADALIPLGQWFTLELIANGNHLIVKVDGKTTTDFVDSSVLPAGHLALCQFAPATIEFRKIEVKELNAEAPPVLAATPGFTPLFNGKDLTGWRPHTSRGGDWRVENGILIGAPSKNVFFLQTVQPQPKDFHLRVEARVGAPGNGSVYFRFQPDGPIVGYEAMIRPANNLPGHLSLGGLAVANPGNGRAFPGGIRPQVPVGQWFTLEIIAEGSHLVVKADGQTTMDVMDAMVSTPGHIALGQITQTTIEFRKIEIKELKPNPPPAFVVTPGFTPLFNGKDLTGWKQPKFGGNWSVENGILVGPVPRKFVSSRLYTEAPQPRDFHLRAEMRVAANTGGSVFVRCPDGLVLGYEARVNVPSVGIGYVSLFSQVPGKAMQLPRRAAPVIVPGQWVTLEVIAEESRLIVKVDGKTASDVVDATALAAGHIALAQYPFARVEFRRVEIKELNNLVIAPPAVVPGEFVPLFNGKDLTGWKHHPQFPGKWHVENGVLVSSGAAGKLSSRLYTERPQPQDFHMRTEMRISDNSAAAVCFRSSDGTAIGYQATITDQRPGLTWFTFHVHGPGFSRQLAHIAKPLAPVNEWFTLDTIAEGKHLIVKIDGKTLTDTVDATNLNAGHILLLRWPNSKVEFRKIEIKELNFVVAPPLPVAPGAFVPLFNGKDLTGWTKHKTFPGDWRVEDGVLIGAAPTQGYLSTARDDYKDFHLRVETRFSDQRGDVEGSVLFRATADALGFHTLLNGPFKATGNTVVANKGVLRDTGIGSLPVPAGQWCTLDITAVGDRIQVSVNGKLIGTYIDKNKDFPTGRITVHQSAKAKLEFKKIEIKELNLVAAAPPAGAPPFPVEDGFVALFNGKDLSGWKSGALQPRAWRVVNGILTGVGGNLNMLYTPRDDYGDFHLRAEARINDDGFSSLMFRYPHGLAELEKQNIGGWAVRLAGRPTEFSKTGSLMVYEKIGMRHMISKAPLSKAGEWFNLEILAKGNFVITKVNGQEAISFLNPKTHLMGGRIVLEANATNRQTVVEYRKIEIKEFKAVAAPAPPPVFVPVGDFVPLFNGKDLTGWKEKGWANSWRVENGVLIGAVPANRFTRLYSEAKFKDFHLRAEVRAGEKALATLGFRSSDGLFHGYNASVRGLPPLGVLTGIINAQTDKKGYTVQRLLPEEKLAPNQWFNLEVIAQGDQLTLLVNGKKTTDAADANIPDAGVIYFGLSGADPVEFRKIEIRELKSRPAPEIIAAANRFAATSNDIALWRVEGNELAHLGKPGLQLFFGDPNWSDYDVNVDFMRTAGNDQFTLLFRRALDQRSYVVMFGAVVNRTHLAGLTDSSGVMTRQLTGAKLQENVLQLERWYNATVKVRGEKGECYLDGVKLFEFKVDQIERGGVGLRASASTYRYKNIKVTAPDGRVLLEGVPDLAPAAAPLAPAGDFVPLFNGKDLTGWKPHDQQPGEWRVIGGILTGVSKGNGHLLTTRGDYKDFHLRIEARSKKAGGIRFRYAPDLQGYETTLNAFGGGMIHVRKAGEPNRNLGKLLLFPGNQWTTLEVIAQGNRLQLKMNGKINVDAIDDAFASGHICLYDFNEAIEFRKLEIKELNLIAAPPPPAVAGGDFVPLFNGKDLTGWQPHLVGAANWRVENGILTGAGVESAILHTKRADYQDFHLRLETRFNVPAEAASSGVVIRSAFGRTGYETIFAAGKLTDGLYISGQDFGKAVPAMLPSNVLSGAWFTLELVAQGNRLKVLVNGKETTDFVDAERTFTKGHIALRQGADGKVEFRKIEIKEGQPVAAPAPEPPPEKAGLAAIFNGKDLAGWQPHPKRPGNWRVENGVLIGSAPNGGSLYSIRGDYSDYHLRAEARINDKGFSRVFARAAYDPTKIPFKIFGYEVLINQRPVGDKLGTLTATSTLGTVMTPARETETKAGAWFVLDVLVRGERVTVKVNGAQVADFVDVKRQFARTGHIVLHQDANALIEFRKVEIGDLAAPKDAEPIPAPRELPFEKGGKGRAFSATFFTNDPGKWRVEGNELVQESLKPNASIFFGNPKWTDYDFSVQAMRTAGNDQFGLWFRRAADNDMYIFGLGGRRSTVHMAAQIKGGSIVHLAPLLEGNDHQVETGRWHHAKVSVRAAKAECFLDGKKVFAVKIEDLAAGTVGLRTWASAYRFKDIKVTGPDGTILLEGLPALASAAPALPDADGFVSLFNGRELVGWKTFANQKGNWRISKGILSASGPTASRAYTPRDDYKNFHLRVEARIGDESFGGLLVRAPFGPLQGYEAPINSNHPRPTKTGSLVGHAPGKSSTAVSVAQSSVPFGEWFLLEVIADGNRVIVKVNGKTTANAVDNDGAFKAGHICLRHEANSTIEFRRIEIKELPAP